MGKNQEIAKELNSIARQLLDLADRLAEEESAPVITFLPHSEGQPQKQTLTINDLADELSISRTSAYQLIHRADFPTLRIGKKILIPRKLLNEWIAEHCREKC